MKKLIRRTWELLVCIVLMHILLCIHWNEIEKLTTQVQQLQTQVSSNQQQIEELERSKADDYFYKKGGK